MPKYLVGHQYIYDNIINFLSIRLYESSIKIWDSLWVWNFDNNYEIVYDKFYGFLGEIHAFGFFPPKHVWNVNEIKM
jgi:hypothetical protein